MTTAKFKVNRFWSIVLTFIVVYALIKWGIPAASRSITALPFPLSVPGTLMFIYMMLTLVALFLLVTFSDEYMAEFLGPVKKFLAGGYGKIPRLLVLVAVPLIAGWQVYELTVPKVELPSSLRIQHPSSNFPKTFEALKNPFANPTTDEVQAFLEQAEANEVSFIPQVQADIDAWMDMTEPEHVLSFIPTKPMQKFLDQLDAGSVDDEIAKSALIEKHLFEGRALYAMNCRPCHGDSVAGDGPMADGFKLRPINFTDNGTIETIVEGYTFWRVTNGGPGLPVEATPWDSAMPEWKLNLTEEERWKIILAEYDLAQKTPRIPETH
ncbi:MAG: c-type cytochrome [Arenicellales bacterium]|nr:c-type cytochrome [Arenicellales bacterium]